MHGSPLLGQSFARPLLVAAVYRNNLVNFNVVITGVDCASVVANSEWDNAVDTLSSLPVRTLAGLNFLGRPNQADGCAAYAMGANGS